MWRFRPPAQTNVVDIYDDFADAWWDFDNPIFEPLYAMVPARTAYLDRQHIDVAGKVVVDVGAGGGYVAEALVARGAHVVGVDIARGALDAAVGRLGLGPHFCVARASALALPFADNSADVVVSTDVLVHVPLALGGARAGVAEAARILKPGGTFWFSTINSSALARFVMITLGEDLLRFVHKGTHEPTTFISPQTMRALCDDVGLDFVNGEGLGPVGLKRGQKGITLRMGRLPTRQVMWQGYARRRGPS
jgi:2-polyprenyl-6-hydroxyphenyl methylase/3-demethylubiquinone-9 3-methyltransferase